MNLRALHDFHDHRYVLTTDRNALRQSLLRAELPGWDLDFVRGLDKADVTKARFEADGVYDEAAAMARDRHRQPMTCGAICCALGHRQIYERFLQSDHERVVVLEDDARVVPGVEALVPAMLDAIPADAELIYWGWTGSARRPWFGGMKQAVYHVQHAAGFLTYDHTMIRNLYPRPYNAHFSLAGRQFCAHAYTLTRSGAATLLRWQTPIIANADNAIKYAVLSGELRAYIALTPVFGQASLDAQSGIPSLTGD